MSLLGTWAWWRDFSIVMADEDNIGQLDNNLNNSNGNNVSSQLNIILKELSNLKQEVYGTNVSVASEVKKLKSEKDIVWRFAGNKIQYDFNSDCSDVVKQAILGYGER